MSPIQYLDFDVDIAPNEANSYAVSVRSPAGEALAVMQFPYQGVELENRKLKVRNALLSEQGRRRRILSPEMRAVQEFGADLFGALMQGEVLNRYDLSCNQAEYQDKGLRLKLHLRSPDLMSLPWEFIFDPRENCYLSLNVSTPIVRYLDLPQVVKPLRIGPPLRILGMIASPSDLEPLDVQQEKTRLEEALRAQINSGQVHIRWMEGATWRDLMQVLRTEEFHIFHFVGHGSFDSLSDEGAVVFCDERGFARLISASELGRLLSDHAKLRLVFLNACEGGRSGSADIFSGVANTLVQRRIPAVLAMQAEITDQAAIEFSRSFYQSLSDGYPVDAAVSEARKAVSLAVKNSLEWGVPVLYMRSPDGRLFDIDLAAAGKAAPAPSPAIAKPETRPAERAPLRTEVEHRAEPSAGRPVTPPPISQAEYGTLKGGWLSDYPEKKVEMPVVKTGIDDAAVQEAFAQLKRKMSVSSIFIVIAFVLFVVISTGVDEALGMIFWIGTMIVYSIYYYRVWRCPNCNASLWSSRPKQCKKCKVRLV